MIPKLVGHNHQALDTGPLRKTWSQWLNRCQGWRRLFWLTSLCANPWRVQGALCTPNLRKVKNTSWKPLPVFDHVTGSGFQSIFFNLYKAWGALQRCLQGSLHPLETGTRCRKLKPHPPCFQKWHDHGDHSVAFSPPLNPPSYLLMILSKFSQNTWEPSMAHQCAIADGLKKPVLDYVHLNTYFSLASLSLT